MEKAVPDFVTVKVIPQAGFVCDHYIVCIIEIKHDDVMETTAKNRMLEYMHQAVQHPS